LLRNPPFFDTRPANTTPPNSHRMLAFIKDCTPCLHYLHKIHPIGVVSLQGMIQMPLTVRGDWGTYAARFWFDDSISIIFDGTNGHWRSD
ncbi:MAG: hypothetical protein QF707_05990, partial [Candidatus Poseidoniaceae archaeon]|nr:hypothetical protein [Candidatus Poseidoniaceae archaeon]